MNFDEKIDRLHTSSVKWERMKEIYGTDDLLPMWVADMDFKPPQEVSDAIKQRAEHGVFGYTFIPPSADEAISQWLLKRHGWEIHHSWLLYSSGVVPSISGAIQALTEPGDKILIQPPVYTPFFKMIELNGRLIELSQLKLTNGRYEIDYGAFENSLKKGVKLFILCNPQNPGGRVWTKEELIKIGELCHRYDCVILSDEIHSDIVLNGHKHVPIASINAEIADRTITFIAPSKTFNLAGLQASAVIIKNPFLRERFKAVQEKQGFHTLNTFGITAMEAAYRKGEDWLAGLIAYIEGNVSLAREFLAGNLPDINMVEPEGTYLLWLDCRKLNLTDEELQRRLIEKGKLGLEPGAKYGPGGEGFVRMNIACPRELVKEGLLRLQNALG